MKAILFGLCLCALACSFLAPALPGQTVRTVPRLEAVAETRLLMEGLAVANFRGLEKLLRQRPEDDTSWVFARGQALLIAETGNLMMLRPPKTGTGQNAWYEHAADLRDKASTLAQWISRKDFERSRISLVNLSQSCNRCHRTFRNPVQITPWQDPLPPGPKV